jgi:hypothetical protein
MRQQPVFDSGLHTAHPRCAELWRWRVDPSGSGSTSVALVIASITTIFLMRAAIFRERLESPNQVTTDRP